MPRTDYRHANGVQEPSDEAQLWDVIKNCPTIRHSGSGRSNSCAKSMVEVSLAASDDSWLGNISIQSDSIDTYSEDRSLSLSKYIAGDFNAAVSTSCDNTFAISDRKSSVSRRGSKSGTLEPSKMKSGTFDISKAESNSGMCEFESSQVSHPVRVSENFLL